MEAIFQASRLVSERAVRGIFGSPKGFTANWGPLYFGQGESLNDHTAFKKFIRESSLGGMDPELMFRVDYSGVSEARQVVLRKDEERANAWKFEAEIDLAHHAELIHAPCQVRWDYFHLHILQRIDNWEEIKLAWDLVSYSVERNIFSEQARASVPVIGYFRHGSDNMRRREVQGMLDGIPGLTVDWNAVHVGKGGSLASNPEYQAFLAASTKPEDKDGADSNQNLRIRVDVRGTSDAAPKKRGPATGSK
jgi:hypothetical protein